MSLVISRQSWHYRLHMFIRKMWGWKPSPFEQWSLCPYFWTIVAGTLLSLIALVPALIGWTFAKLMRKAYKSGSKGGPFAWWVKFCDNTRLGGMLDKSADEFNDGFMWAGLAYLSILLFWLLVVAAFGSLIVLVCLAAAKGVSNAPHYLMLAVLHVGWALFYIFAGVGIALAYAVFGVTTAAVWLYHGIIDGAIWLWHGASKVAVLGWAKVISGNTWIGIGKWLLTVISSIIVCIASFVLVILFAAYGIFNEKLWAWAEMKANGYAEARKTRVEKQVNYEQTNDYWQRREAKEIAEARAWARRRERNERIIGAIWDYLEIAFKIIFFVPVFVGIAIWRILVAVGVFLRNLYAKPVVKDGRRVKQLGPLGVLITMLFAFKKRACPLIEFADNNDLTDSPHPRPPTPPPFSPTPPAVPYAR